MNRGAQLLEEAIRLRGMSVEDAADWIGMRKWSLYRILYHGTIPKRQNMEKIRQKFGVDPGEFFKPPCKGSGK